MADFISDGALEQQYHLVSERKEAQTAMKQIQGLEDKFRSTLKVCESCRFVESPLMVVTVERGSTIQSTHPT